MALYEIRDYTIDPEWFDRYVTWAREHATPWIMSNLDALGFWVHDGQPAEVAGSSPVVSPNGQPNVTWILRWPDRATRDAEFPRKFGSDSWKEVWAKHPNPDSYVHMNARFMERLDS
ncbi:MAG TPA: hypothetical protein DCR65_06745 [Gammaproteobacteria bacterium]|jgi:hypothetical protein|nr:hypothetical protein [Gammaproteobacteria bacterium]